MAKKKTLTVDLGIVEALQIWQDHGIYPGSCAYLLLKGDYEEAKRAAHPLLLPHWEDHVAYVKTLPIYCRGECTDSWPEDLKKIPKPSARQKKL